MYGTLVSFLSSGNSMSALETYDFKNESPWGDVINEENALKKFVLYKSHNQNRDGTHFDCDGSDGTCTFANDIYQKLWGWSYQDRFHLPEMLACSFGGKWERVGSDTMNSFAITYSVAQKLYQNNNNGLANNELLNKFAALTHSIGNFTLVPFKLIPQDVNSFNQSRGYRGDSGNRYFVYDYFDLSLKLIKENTEQQVFRDYINTFFLNDYVDKDYNIIPLFCSHKEFLAQEKMSLVNPEKFLPKTLDELNEYLDNVLRRIEARGMRIVEELKKKEVGDVAQSQQNTFAEQKKKDTPEWLKRVKRLLKQFVVCYIIASIGYFSLIMVELFKYISVPDAIKEYGLYGLFCILVEIFKAVVRVDFFLTSIVITICLLITLKLIHGLLVRFANKHLMRCRSCHRLYAMKKIKREMLRKESISIKVELKDRNRNGEVCGTHEQFIPGTRTVYMDTYECKYCGSIWFEEINVDTENT